MRCGGLGFFSVIFGLAESSPQRRKRHPAFDLCRKDGFKVGYLLECLFFYGSPVRVTLQGFALYVIPIDPARGHFFIGIVYDELSVPVALPPSTRASLPPTRIRTPNPSRLRQNISD